MPQNEAPRVFIYSGHSGGHLSPAIAFSESFKKRYPGAQLTLITSPKAAPILDQLPSGFFSRILFLPEFPSPSGLSLRSAKFLIKLLSAFLITFRHLVIMKPDLSIGFGSYVAFPGLKLSVLMNIPTLIHEQNVIPGKATRWLARSVRKVAVSYQETFLHNAKVNRVFTGLPLRSELVAAASEFRLERDDSGPRKFRILVVGGSQGSSRMNQLILDAFSRFSSEELEKIAVNHVTGAGDYEKISRTYQKMNIEFKTFAFHSRLYELYQQTDFAITRAGANTLAELALFGIPALVIPYPYASAHQEDNARAYESQGALVVGRESELTGEKLAELVRYFMSHSDKCKHLSANMKAMACQNAETALVAEAVSLLQGRN